MREEKFVFRICKVSEVRYIINVKIFMMNQIIVIVMAAEKQKPQLC